MSDVARFRDSTQIRLPRSALDGIRDEIETRFTVTIRSEEECVRIIGSPLEIKNASDFLARNGVAMT